MASWHFYMKKDKRPERPTSVNLPLNASEQTSDYTPMVDSDKFKREKVTKGVQLSHVSLLLFLLPYVVYLLFYFRRVRNVPYFQKILSRSIFAKFENVIL